MKAVQVSRFGGPEVLEYVDLPEPNPASGQVLVEMKAIGVNFRDVTMRANKFPADLMGRSVPDTPFVLGSEGAGIVSKIGCGVTEVSVGDRVAFFYPEGASYAEKVVVPSWRLVPVPTDMDLEVSAAALLQGLTAHLLAHSTYPIQPDDYVLVHAAAGGVGSLLTQIAKWSGAYVIGTVSTATKARFAQDLGADDVIIYTEHDFAEEVARITHGSGVNVVYDAIGLATFEKSLASLGRRGYLVMYGSASGPVSEVNASIFTRRSMYLTRASLLDYTETRSELLARSEEIFEWIKSGRLRLSIYDRIPLRDAALAHRELENRITTGKVLLIP